MTLNRSRRLAARMPENMKFEGKTKPLRLQDLPAELACEILTLKCLWKLCADNDKGHNVDRIAELSGRNSTIERVYADALCERGDAKKTTAGLYRITEQGIALLVADDHSGWPSLTKSKPSG